MLRITMLFLSAISVAGCDSYIGISEHQARVESANYMGWLSAKADGREETIREIGVTVTGQLAEGGEAVIPLDVTGAHRALVVATCDRNCLDLDLRVVTDDGRLIGFDEDDDNTPRVYISEKKTNKLVAKVRMPRCSAKRCTYALTQLEYEDYVGGYGTCFAVSPSGLLMTSYHVVAGASKIKVTFPDGRKGDATILRSSPDNDLALLRTSIATPHWLPLKHNSDIAIGTPVFTLGFPSPALLGSEMKLTDGSISSLSGMKESTVLQISVPIQGGNSGGPLIDDSGQVVGVVEAGIDEDNDGDPLQLTNFARHARVASLLLPSNLEKRSPTLMQNRQQAIAHASKAVCQIRTE